MKKVILTVAAIFAFGFANAQDKEVKDASGFGFSSGNVFVEGSIGFSNSNNKNTETTVNSFNVSPKLGYFINDKFAIGLELNFGSSKTDVDGTETANTSDFGVGAFGRYYFLNLGERFKTYTEFGFSMNTEKDAMATPEIKSTDINVGLGLGMNYFLTPKMAISFELCDVISYNTSKTDADGDEGTSSFNANINVFNNFFDTAQFGLLYKF